MKIYIASSWKNSVECIAIGQALRNVGHEVDCFCDQSIGRYVFSFEELGDVTKINCIQALESGKVQRAFAEDKKWIDWSDAVLVILPCGKSAHLEAGYAKGAGKKLYIYGRFPNGELDVMYGFADKLYMYLTDLFNDIKGM